MRVNGHCRWASGSPWGTPASSSRSLSSSSWACALGTPVCLPAVIANKVTSVTTDYMLAALLHRRSTGQGRHIAVPMTDTLLAFNLLEHLAGHKFQATEGPTGLAAPMGGHRRAARRTASPASIPRFRYRARTPPMSSPSRATTEPRFPVPPLRETKL